MNHSTNSAHRGKMIGYDKFSVAEFQNFPERSYHPGICCNSSAKCNRFEHFFSMRNGAFEITGQCKTQARNDILQWCSYLLQMDHITFGKNTASSGNSGGMSALQSHGSKLLFNRKPDSFCLLIQERSGSGSTDAVHFKVRQAWMYFICLLLQEN